MASNPVLRDVLKKIDETEAELAGLGAGDARNALRCRLVDLEKRKAQLEEAQGGSGSYIESWATYMSSWWVKGAGGKQQGPGAGSPEVKRSRVGISRADRSDSLESETCSYMSPRSAGSGLRQRHHAV